MTGPIISAELADDNDFSDDEWLTMLHFHHKPAAVESFRHRPSCPGVVNGDCPCPPTVVRAL